MSKIIEIGKTYSLDLSGSSPVEVEPISFTEKGVKCKYLNSTPGRIEELGYELFEMNGYAKPSENDVQLTFKDVSYAPNSITFMLNNTEEVIKLSNEGFFYKGKLIVEDKEIYLRFKEWMDQAHSQIPKSEPQKFNSIEERDNLISLLQEVLKFYADKNNYKKPVEFSKYNVLSKIELDEGSQAHAVLERAKQLAKENQKIQDEYDSYFSQVEPVIFDPDAVDAIKTIHAYKSLKNDKNI
jgi:hypothetical protein